MGSTTTRLPPIFFMCASASARVEKTCSPVRRAGLLNAGRQQRSLGVADKVNFALVASGRGVEGYRLGSETDQQVARIDLGLDRIGYPVSADETLGGRDARQDIGCEDSSVMSCNSWFPTSASAQRPASMGLDQKSWTVRPPTFCEGTEAFSSSRERQPHALHRPPGARTGRVALAQECAAH